MTTKKAVHATEDYDPATTLNRVDEAVCTLDEEWRFTFLNDDAASMLEYTPDALLGEDVWEAIPGLKETTVGTRLRQAMETQTSCRFESYNEALERWFKVRIYPADDGITVFFYDITTESGEQLELQRQQRLFETVFEETEDALIIADTDQRITDFNPAAERLFGYDAEEVIGKKSHILYADTAEYEEQVATRFNEPAPDHEGTYIIEYEQADGTTFNGETFGTALNSPDGESLAFLTSVRDVSEQLEYETEIEARNEALQTFHDITTDDDRSIDEQIRRILALGASHLELDTGVVSTIDNDEYTVEYAHNPDASVQPGDQFPLSKTLCEQVVATGKIMAAHDVETSELSHPVDVPNTRNSYIGTPLIVDGECYGTLNFSDPVPRSEPFTDGERTFVRVLAQWIGKELGRQRTKDRAAANRDRLRQIIDLLPQLVFAKDRDNEYILANQAIADAYGSSVEEVEGSTDADFVTPKEAEQFRQDDLEVIDSGEPKMIPEESLTTADGETRTLQTTKIPYDPVGHDTEAVLGVATDITETKQRERELEETTQRLTVALEGTNAGVWELDLATETVIWTESMEPLFGLEPGTTEGTYEEFLDLVHPDDVSTVQESFKQVSNDGDMLQVEYRIQHNDGSEKWIEARAELLAGEQTDRRLVGIATDITDRKERDAEIELQTAAMEAAMDGIAILDGDEYVYMNQAHADIFDYDPEELIGCEWRKLYGDTEIDRIETEVFPALAETGEWRGETLGRKQDGTPVHQDLGLSLLDSGELICTNRNITAQKEREQKLERQRTRIRALFDNSPDGVIVHDETGAILDANETQLDVLGIDREDLDSLNVADFEVGIEQSELASIWAEMDADDVLKVEGEHRRQDGSTFPVEVWVNKFNIDGDTRYIAVSRDITEQKRLESSLRESEQSVRKLTSIAADTEREFDDKLSALLELGTERLGLPIGFVNRLDGQTQHIVTATGDHPDLQSGATVPKSETYCRKTIQQSEPLAIENAVDSGWEGDPAYEQSDLGCYIGRTVFVDGEEYGTLCFADRNSRDCPFDESERAFVELLAQWLSHELTSRDFETKLRDINEISQNLITAQSKAEISTIAIESARTILDMPINAVWWYDEAADALVPAGDTEAAAAIVPEQPTFERGEALAWDAFETDKIQVFQDLSEADGVYNRETEFQSEAIVPFGDYGVMSAASTESKSFSETELNLLEVLASTVEAALTRAEREEVLRETQQKLEQSNEKLDQFASMVSHDLRNPLTVILGRLQYLDRNTHQQEHVDAIERSATRMENMITDLLELSRAGQNIDEKEPVSLASVAAESWDKTQPDRTDFDLQVPESATVEADKDRLMNVFENLFRNAREHNDPPLTVRVGTLTNAVADSNSKSRTGFYIEDNGDGIPNEERAKTFEHGYTTNTDGTGFGLSIVEGIVEAHGWSISICDGEDGGARFEVSDVEISN